MGTGMLVDVLSKAQVAFVFWSVVSTSFTPYIELL